jgi:hypothetical protein
MIIFVEISVTQEKENEEFYIKRFKDLAQTALFKGPIRTAQ